MSKEVLIKLLDLLPELLPELAAAITAFLQSKGIDVVALIAAMKKDDADALALVDSELAKLGD